jgi:hypothetical protein
VGVVEQVANLDSEKNKTNVVLHAKLVRLCKPWGGADNGDERQLRVQLRVISSRKHGDQFLSAFASTAHIGLKGTNIKNKCPRTLGL